MKLGRSILLLAVLAGLLLVLGAESASAQCAMCRTALEQDGGKIAAGFNRAILFLLGMPYIVFASIAGSWYWKRRETGGAADSSSAGN